MRPIAISCVLRANGDGPTDGPTDKAAYRVAWTRLRMIVQPIDMVSVLVGCVTKAKVEIDDL